MYHKILYLLLLIIILISQLGSHTYNFTNYKNWLLHIPGKKIYLINGVDYCICTNLGIFFNEYLCTQNVSFKSTYINPIEYNINQIIPIVTNKINFLNWFILIYSLYCIISYIINFINSYIINTLWKLFFSSKQSDTNTNTNTKIDTKYYENKNTSIFDNIYEKNLFGNIFGNSSQSIEVKIDSNPSITINNFIGCENIKKEINKVINQIKYYNIYKDYLCELPKGILLIGPPGVGKTHLVKTIINSTGMKYIFKSGSDFNKIFVGSGSLNVEQLFKKARENKPCLIFIDEADSILKKRSHNETSSASTEFNSTICKFLAEMDSLKTESGVVIVFATNMDENYIDKGILRAGRIDQIIHINHPTLEERIELFKMYLKKLYKEELIDLNIIAKLSYGLNGSDIKKIVNLIQINKVHEYLENNPDQIGSTINTNSEFETYFLKDDNIPINITTKDIDKEISKCILGLEQERKINQMNIKIIAYHEAGHAIMAYLIKDSILPSKICISINSKSLGYTLFPQKDDDLLLKTSIKQLLNEVIILYAGRISEKLFVGENEVTCGAEDDYMKARIILKRLLMNGMIIPEYNFVENSNKDEKIPEYIEKKIISINKIILNKIKNILELNSILVHKTAEKLIEFNSITSDDINEIFKNTSQEHLINSYDITTSIYNNFHIHQMTSNYIHQMTYN
jgi:ATP-dependent Zn protease